VAAWVPMSAEPRRWTASCWEGWSIGQDSMLDIPVSVAIIGNSFCLRNLQGC